MTQLKNALLLALLLVAIGYGGVKGYIYYKVKTRIDNIAIQASPYVGIEYEGISSTLDGSVTLENITLRPKAFDDYIRMDSLTIITPGLNFLLSGSQSINPGEFPSQIGISIRELRIDLLGEMVNVLKAAEAQNVGFTPGKGLVCTFSQSFLAEQYRELGLDELLMDADIRFEHSKGSGTMHFTMESTLRGIEEWDMELAFRLMPSPDMAMMPFVPSLSSIALNYRPNQAFTQQVNQYCAKLKDTTPEEFIEQLVQQSDADYMQDIGFVPGPGIRSALRQMLTQGSELKIVAQPPEPIDLSKIHLYNPQDIPDLLGLLVSVDDKPIDDLSFTQPQQVLSRDDIPAQSFNTPLVEMLRNAIQPEVPDTQTGTKEDRQLQTGSYKLKSVTVEELKEMIGREARITTSDGKIRSGRISQVQNDTISLQSRLHGGTFSIHIPFEKAEKIEALLWVE